MAKYSKEQIIEILKNLSSQLGRPKLSVKDIAKVIPPSTVCRHFGNVGNALKEAGLEATPLGENLKDRGKQLSDEDLFQALYKVERKIGHMPGVNDCSAHGDFSTKPYYQRFGKWPDVLAHYRKWKSDNSQNLQEVSSQEDIGETARQNKGDDSSMTENRTPAVLDAKKHRPPDQFYGEPIDFRGLRHAPINEQGVVFLFAIVSRELGFNIESIQQGFPDCEGKYLYDRKKKLYAKARIEFEYRASSFQEHGHDPNQCDFIVCWENDWPECPVNIIELKTEIMKLPSR